MKIYFRTFYILLLILFSSCKSNVFTKEQLLSYVNRNSALNKSVIVDDIKVDLKYYPGELLALQEFESIDKSGKSYSVLMKKYNDQYYFHLSFSKNGNDLIRQMGSFHQYSDMLQVMSFEMGKYVNASTEKTDSVFLMDYVFDQNYGMSHNTSILLVFSKKHISDAKNLIININEFGLGIGNLPFTFNVDDLDKIPKISKG